MDINSVIVLFLLVLVLSLGAPIAPGTLILCLATLLPQIGIDAEVVSLIIGINFILEMIIGAVNSMGDVIITMILSVKEGTIDLEVYNKK